MLRRDLARIVTQLDMNSSCHTPKPKTITRNYNNEHRSNTLTPTPEGTET
jgi:hypothetical protein